MSFDPVAFGTAMGAMLRDAVAGLEKALAPRIKALEERPLPEAIKGDPGEPGKDGASFTREDAQELVRAAVESEQARWALDFERRAQGVLERAIERVPPPAPPVHGKDGVDGMGFDDLTVEHDGERGFTIKLQQGERVKEFAFSVPVVIDRGFWLEGKSVAKGDGVTFGGSYWIAQKDTTAKPETTCADWRLAVKKGRDGK